MNSDESGRFAPASTRDVPRFAGVPTFLRLPLHDDPADLDVWICGAPFDGGTTYRPGARFGPRAVRVSSALSRGYDPHGRIDVFAQLRCADGGDVACVPMDVQRTLASIEQRAHAAAVAGAVPIFIGGDHTVSLAPLRALAKIYGPLSLLHFDAHSDTFGPAWGIDLHHGTVFRKAVEEGLLRGAQVLQVGIRGPFTAAVDLDFAREAGFTIADMDRVRDDFASVVASIAALGGPLYVSFDMDAVDPAYAPGTGTPVPGGLTSYEALRLLRSLHGKRIVGCDVVEISPDHDIAGQTAQLAVAVLGQMLVGIAAGKRGGADG